jgi:hypothetical protein
MTARPSLVTVCVAVALSFPTSLAAEAGPPQGQALRQDDEPRRDRRDHPDRTIRGTVELNGCEASARAIEIAASLIDDGEVVLADRRSASGMAVPAALKSRDSDNDGRSRRRRPNASTARAEVRRTPDAGTFAFVFSDLRRGRPYRLSIGLRNDRCGKVFWRGPKNGVSIAGDASVRLEGFAARTRLEIRERPSNRDDSFGRAAWVGGDDLQFTDPRLAVRTLRWTSDLPDVTGGELQVSASAFPTQGAFGACDEPAGGLLWRQPVGFRPGGWTVLPAIDFSTVLSAARVQRVSSRADQRILSGAPIHMRVVPYTADGPLCDTKAHGVHGEVLVAKLPSGDIPSFEPPAPTPILTAASSQIFTPAYLPPLELRGFPSYGELGYLVIKDHQVPPIPCYTSGFGQAFAKLDPYGCLFIHLGWAEPGDVIGKGSWFFFRPNPSSGSSGPLSIFSDTLGPLATAAFKAAGTLVNLASAGLEEIKNFAADVALQALTFAGLGPVCDALGDTGLATCEDLIKTGIEVGMASMGIPPSLPNWEELQAQGVDYLAAQVAKEIAGNSALAQEVTEAMLKELATQALAAMNAKRSEGMAPGYDWMIPYLGFNPASWSVAVAWTGSAPLPTDELFIDRKSSSLFSGARLPLPTNLLPNIDAMRIPMVLQPNFAGIPSPFCRFDRFGDGTCQPSVFNNPQPVCQYQSYTGNGQYTWANLPCAQHWIDVYYRDQWTARQDATPCAKLLAVSQRWLTYSEQPGGLQIAVNAPAPPFFEVAFVNPVLPAIWSGPVFANCQ